MAPPASFHLLEQVQRLTTGVGILPKVTHSSVASKVLGAPKGTRREDTSNDCYFDVEEVYTVVFPCGHVLLLSADYNLRGCDGP